MFRNYLRFLAARKAHVLAFVGLALAQPVLELATFSLLYLLISPTRYPGVRAVVDSLPVAGPLLARTAIPILLFGAALTVVLAQAFTRSARTRAFVRVRYDTYREALRTLFEHYLMLPPRRILAQSKDELTAAAINEVGAISSVLTASLNASVQLISVAVLIAGAVFFSPGLAAAALTMGALAVALNRKRIMAVREIGEIKTESQREMLKEVSGILRGVERIKYDALEPVALDRMSAAIQRSYNWRRTKSLRGETISIFSDTYGLVAMLVIVFLSVAFFTAQPATLVVLLILFARTRGYVSAAQADVVNARTFWPASQSAIRLMESLKPEPRTRTSVPLGTIHRIELRNAAFAYDHTPVLRGIHLTLQTGDRVLVQGPSGQGKSTLLGLLSGFHEPTEGSVEIVSAGEERQPLAFSEVRGQLAYAADDLYVFDSSVRRAVDPGGTLADEQVWHALDQALLGQAIRALPQGLDASVGDNAANLSLGQRQRLLMARLFLRRPRLVLLDEATSNLDVETEERIFANLTEHLPKEAIIVVATHRPPESFQFTKRLIVGVDAVQAMPLSEKKTLTAIAT